MLARVMVVFFRPVSSIVIGMKVGFRSNNDKLNQNSDELGIWAEFSYSINSHWIFPLFCAEITQAEAYDILKKCVLEIQKRLIINLNNFKVSVVDQNGVRKLDDITSKTLLNYVP